MVEKMEPIQSTVPPRLMSEGHMQREAGGNRPGCVRGERVVDMLPEGVSAQDLPDPALWCMQFIRLAREWLT